jgi:gamma-glutamylcyclotransferase (GGCT)/AIG2-like uncharacterized protein YtfP
MKDRKLYFAFGSNMNALQMQHRCPSSSRVGAASMEGVRITFCGRSKWGGGVATIEEADAVTEGVIWQLTDADIDCLDRYEGAPVVYRKVPVLVTMENGMTVEAFTYRKNDTTKALPSVPYLTQIMESYEAEGFDFESLLSALDDIGQSQPQMTRVFVYGSLMNGFGNNRLLSDSEWIDDATFTTFSHGLISLGAFPALAMCDDGEERVIHGEVYEVDEGTLRNLDQLEGHPTFYERREIELDDGEIVFTYFLNDDRSHQTEEFIESGSWRRFKAVEQESRWQGDLFRWKKLGADL